MHVKYRESVFINENKIIIGVSVRKFNIIVIKESLCLKMSFKK